MAAERPAETGREDEGRGSTGAVPEEQSSPGEVDDAEAQQKTGPRGQTVPPQPGGGASAGRPPAQGFPMDPAAYRPRHPPKPPPPPPAWLVALRPDAPAAAMRAATGWATLAAALLAASLLNEGLGVNLLLVALAVASAAHFAARHAGRRPRPWTLLWAVGGLALLVIPALRDANWPSVLAVLAALGAGSLALQGGRRWPAVLLAPLGLAANAPRSLAWGWRGMRERARGGRRRWGPLLRAGLVAVGLLVVFGALFAGADAAFADLVAGLLPEVHLDEWLLRLFLAFLGLLLALTAARTAAAPWRWDRVASSPGPARGPLEWALPLVVLDVLFAAFVAVQLRVLLGGYDEVLAATGLTYAEYARQGFWQLLMATVLTLVVIALALRWAPRGRRRDATLVRAVLGTLCALTLVVVFSALRRMDLYVEAYGLTRLRLSVAGIELWLGVVVLLVMIAGALGTPAVRTAAWLPRAVAVSAVAAVLVFGLVSPDGLVAEQNVARYERTGRIDLLYLRELSADAAPALDRLPEPQRSCVLGGIASDLAADGDEPWYATSLGEARAADVLADRPVDPNSGVCRYGGSYEPGRRDAGPYGTGVPGTEPRGAGLTDTGRSGAGPRAGVR